MDLSTLKLVIEKGPREGETLEFNSKPGFTIRIGRLVRGNTIAIKDNGISSKHLSIECCNQDKWVVKDLESSNGSLLNSSPLPPFTGYDLRDGDVLKIGEVTSIRVRISHVSDSQPVGRNLRSGARVLGTGNSDCAQKVSDEGNRRGRGRGTKSGDKGLGSEISKNVEGITQKGGAVSKRRTRNSKNEEDKVEIVGESLEKGGDTECKEEPPISLRRTTRSRGMKNKDNSAFTSGLEMIPEASQLVGSNNCEALENVAPAVNKKTRTTRGRKKIEVETESAQSVTVEDKGSEQEISEEHISTESMCNIVEEENCHEREIVVVKPEPQSNVDRIVSKGEHPSKESMSEIAKKDGDLACQLNFEHETGDELVATSNQDDRIEPECDTGVVNFQESTAAVGASTDKDDEAEIAPDLSNMTLGEWLDYLEKFLPKQIRAETDKTIQDMQRRSQQFHEFMLQQQKDKGTLPLG